MLTQLDLNLASMPKCQPLFYLPWPPLAAQQYGLIGFAKEESDNVGESMSRNTDGQLGEGTSLFFPTFSFYKIYRTVK